jgi:hypothetical protein
MEYNKGKLIRVDEPIEKIAERIVVNMPSYYESKLEYFRDNHHEFDYAILCGVLYRVEWISKSADLDEIYNLTKDENGDLHFETYHYNGGADWTELVEDKLRVIDND